MDINYLKENCKRIYYFGLGFIQVVISKEERYHFYTDRYPTTNEDLHNHRYNFISTIIQGRFINDVYELCIGESHVIRNESCNESKIVNNNEILTGVKHISTTEYTKGESYFMPFNTFHEVRYDNNTITQLLRTDYIMDYAQVVSEVDAPEICPFSLKIDESELWETIEEMINKKDVE